jgi:hypothetical protein
MELNNSEICKADNVIRISKQGVFTIAKFFEIYQTHDLQKTYTIFDALRNRIDDTMITEILTAIQQHPLNTIILVSSHITVTALYVKINLLTIYV